MQTSHSVDRKGLRSEFSEFEVPMFACAHPTELHDLFN